MNSNSTSDPNALAFGVSFPERYLQFAVYLTCGTISCVGNTLMAYGITKCKEMRSRFYVVIIFLLISRVLQCFQWFFLCVYRFMRVIDVVNFTNRIGCALMGLFIYPGTLELLLLLALAFDRVIALFAINYYRNLNCRQAIKMCSLISLISLIVKIGLLFGDASFTATVSCFSIFEGIPALNATFSSNFDLALLVFLLVAYIAMLVVLQIRLRKLRATSDNDATLVAINRHMTLMPTLRNIVVVHCVWTLSAKILLTLGIQAFPAAYSARFTLYGGFFVASEALVNVVCLLYTNADIRKATLSCFRLNKIEPTSSMISAKIQTPRLSNHHHK